MSVPKGGSSCRTCIYFHRTGGPHGTCGNTFFQAFYGTNQLPCPPDEYCSDWYEPAVKTRGC